MRRPAVLVALLGAASALGGLLAVRRERATRAESAFWHEAGTAPDLR